MFCGNSVIIGMIILLVVGYLVVYGSSSTTIKEGLTCPGPRKYKQIASNQSCNWNHAYRGRTAQKILNGSLADLQKDCDDTPGCEYVDYVYRQWESDRWSYGDLWGSGDCPEAGWARNTARNIYQAIPNTCNANYKKIDNGTCESAGLHTIMDENECLKAGTALGWPAFRYDQPPGGYSYAGSGRTRGCTHNPSGQNPTGPGTAGTVQYFPNASGECGSYSFDCVCATAEPSCSGAGEPCDANNDTCCGCCGVNDPATCQPASRGSPGCADHISPPSCAAFISHNDCPAGTTSKPVNTTCSAANAGDCYDQTCGCKCYLTDGQVAGQPRCLPTTSNTGKGRWPNTQAKGYNANMNCGGCLPRSTESACNAAGGWCYWGVPSEEQIPGSCPGENCTSSDCCTPNPTCFSLGSCPEYSNMPTPSLVCQGPVCNRSIGGECCKPNPVCSPDVCDLNTQVFTGAGTKCVSTVCSQAECCQPRAQCNEGVQCNPNLYDQVKNYSSKYCKGVVCELSECCVADPTCHNYKCPKYYADKPNMSKIKCGEGDACDVAKCCNLNPTCSSYFGGLPGTRGDKHGGCPVHEHLNKNVAEIRCLEPQCSTGECCSFDPKCSTFNCTEDNFYHTYAHVPNAENIYCDNDLCREEQCCVATPTYALPEVETWPLYPDNYQ